MRTARRSMGTFALLFAVALAGCSDAAMSPFEPSVSAEASSQSVPIRLADKKALDLDGAFVEQTIGAAGGGITVGGVKLKVPAGAVLMPTDFRVELHAVDDGSGGHSLEVELTATREILGIPTDVGNRFYKPLLLTMSYRRTNATVPANLRIMLKENDGTLVPVPSRVVTGNRTVVARLRHFSRYCMVSD